jgi:DNA-binding beta-propeller fold protein YncE
VHKGDVVRIVLDLTQSPPAVLRRVVIASGFAEKTDPNALVIGPTGLAIGPDGTVYVADTLSNRVAAIAEPQWPTVDSSGSPPGSGALRAGTGARRQGAVLC